MSVRNTVTSFAPPYSSPLYALFFLLEVAPTYLITQNAIYVADPGKGPETEIW